MTLKSIACFHAQQAIEKSLKAVLFAIEIEFGRTHDLIKLAQLARSKGVSLPIPDGELRKLNPLPLHSATMMRTLIPSRKQRLLT